METKAKSTSAKAFSYALKINGCAVGTITGGNNANTGSNSNVNSNTVSGNFTTSEQTLTTEKKTEPFLSKTSNKLLIALFVLMAIFAVLSAFYYVSALDKK
ncbi:MAG: hypothetical protein WC755_04985 [Candidatus Woesearchaeota archaeon]|jgi:hypothetical protein